MPRDRFAAAVCDVERAVTALGVPLAGFEGTGTPLFRDDAIVFNGEGGNAVEPFEVQQTEFDRRGRPTVSSHCKTTGAPYDAAVRIALIVLKHHLGEQFSVTSDSRDVNDEGWRTAREFGQRTLRYEHDFTVAT